MENKLNSQTASKSGENSARFKEIFYRRKFIRSELNRHGRITAQQIVDWSLKNEKGRKLTPKVIRGDIKFIEEYEDREIIPVGEGLETSWLDGTQKTSSTRDQRLKQNVRSKEAIAESAASLILGLRKFSFTQRDSTHQSVIVSKFESLLDQLFPKPKYAALVKEFDASSNPLAEKIKLHLQDSSRVVFLDSGTTAQILAEKFLQHLEFPKLGLKEKFTGKEDPFTTDEVSVEKLEVITNDRLIFNCLGQSFVHAKTIIVGGRQQHRSCAVSGMMAQRFLEVNGLRAHVAFLGATHVRLGDTSERCYFGADNEHIAAIKLEFAKRSDLRVVLADSSKFTKAPGHGDFRLCAINPGNIDMVITDKGGEKFKGIFKRLNVPLVIAGD